MAFQISSADNATFVSSDSKDCLETLIIAILDGSGSMGDGSSRPGGGAAPEAALFSRMDIVKHAAKTVASIAGSQAGASLALVRFSDDALTLLPATRMDETGVARAHAELATLSPGGLTNIKVGLDRALSIAETFSASRPAANVHIILLTDGEPTADYLPASGLVNYLDSKLVRLPVRPVVSCFGFGTNLDAKLLEQLSKVGNGTFGYIPDCSMAGTVFINYCAAALTTVATNVWVNGEFVGNVLAGSKRTIYRSLPVGTAASVVSGSGSAKRTDSVQVVQATAADADTAKVIQKLREAIARASEHRSMQMNNFAALNALHAWVSDGAQPGSFRAAVMTDLEHADANKGQLTRAYSREDWFNTWGLNHLLSYSRGLACEQCINFKEAAHQFFASPEFNVLKRVGDDLFDSLPAPKPSLLAYAAPSVQAQHYAAPPKMANLNTDSGGCFTGDSLIQMSYGTVRVDRVKAGDTIDSGHRIRCIVRTKVDKPTMMVSLSDHLTITPWHPTRLPGTQQWVFPADLVSVGRAWPYPDFTGYYYTFVMESGHVMKIGGMDVCGLAHEFRGAVIGHEFYGTQAVVKMLQKHSGWDQGLVDLKVEDWVLPAHLQH